MKNRILSIIALCGCMVATATAHASVWKVEKDNDVVYIGGTIHVLSASDYPLPQRFSNAYNLADEVVFETDIEKLEQPEFQASLMQRLTYPVGETIAADLSSETLVSLEQHLTKRGVAFEQLARFKPSLMGITITAIELKLAGINTQGVDAYYNKQASEDGKKISWLETVDAQIKAISSMANGQEDEFIRYSIDSASETPNIVNTMINMWRNGDIDGLNEEFAKPLLEDYPQVYDAMLTQRNNAWMPKIELMFDDDDTELVLVGMLHLAGKNSIFDQLASRGYTISKL